MLLKMTEKMFTLKTTSSGLQVCRLKLKVRCTTEISDIRVELAMVWRTCTINKRKSNGCRGRYPTLQPNNVNQFLLLYSLSFAYKIMFVGAWRIIPPILVAKFESRAVLLVSHIVWFALSPIHKHDVILCRLPNKLSLH